MSLFWGWDKLMNMKCTANSFVYKTILQELKNVDAQFV